MPRFVSLAPQEAPARRATPGGTPPPSPPEGPRPFPLGVRLDAPADYDEIFRVVRGAVRHVLGIERTGLGLGLSNLPPSLGAYWPVTGNLIVLNEGLVQAMRANATSAREYNSFVFVILAHEYLHALGYLDEAAVRRVTASVAREALGPDHPASRMASGDLWRMYPFLQYAPRGDGRRLRVIGNFDSSSTQQYIR
ncbi:MAG TPA: hypothetical protein VMH78_00725 [Thermoplasmata archaeon]|nr:hypothetical protein [Thermoplasmata archaeon]